MENKEKSYVVTLNPALAHKLKEGLLSQGFELSKPTHTLFSGKKKGVSCTLFTSGKLLVQGKEMRPFIEFFLEPEILGSFTFTNPTDPLNLTPRIGIDESGKGDYFGPLCIAGVYADEKTIPLLKKLGVRDSKEIKDLPLLKMADEIKKIVHYHIVKINPQKYNELYTQFANLNTLLAWGHATTIENLVRQTGCINVTIDQFAAEWVVKTALKRKKMEINLTQRHRAEEDLVVAAASILSRACFLKGLEDLERELNIKLPKGASDAVVKAAKQVVANQGKDALPKVAKLHFKTTQLVLN